MISPVIDLAEISRRVPLFAGLDADDLRYVLSVARQISYAPGVLLVRQGQPADSALIMERGHAQVVNALPGGGETVVADVGPGSVLGETALLDSGVRMANVVARAPTACLSMERDAFRMLIAQGNQAVLAINHRITLSLCQRLRELNGKILAVSAPENLPLAAVRHTHERRACDFDYRAFLGVLPALHHFSPEDIDELLSAAQVFDVPRGARLFEAGTPSEACYVVVRGALEISRDQNGAHRRIGILGPGRLCGVLGLIEGQRHSMSATAREHATLLELPRDAFMRYYKNEYSGGARGALKFQRVINQELLQSLSRTNNHLTSLISQARIRNHVQHADDLQLALVEQECRTGVR